MFLKAHGKKTQKGSFVRSVNDGTASGVGEVDVVPMINVVFLLLIFFMVVGVFRSAVDNNFVFPKTNSGAENVSQNLQPQVVIDRNGELIIDGRSILRTDVFSALQELAKTDSLLVQADANAPANDIIFVLRLATDAGFTTAGLQTIQQTSSAR